MPSFNIVATHHTSFTVTNLDRSVAFFRDVLGFSLTHTERADSDLISGLSGVPKAEGRLAFIAAPGHTIELVEYSGPETRGKVKCRPCDAGSSHIAFIVDDLDNALAAVTKAGLALIGTPQTVLSGDGAGARSVYLRDADSIQFEFIQLPKQK